MAAHGLCCVTQQRAEPKLQWISNYTACQYNSAVFYAVRSQGILSEYSNQCGHNFKSLTPNGPKRRKHTQNSSYYQLQTFSRVLTGVDYGVNWTGVSLPSCPSYSIDLPTACLAGTRLFETFPTYTSIGMRVDILYNHLSSGSKSVHIAIVDPLAVNQSWCSQTLIEEAATGSV